MQSINRTASQKRAIDCNDPLIVCLAGPGAGKTTVLVERIARLLEEDVDSTQIVALTYTNKAARELEERLGLFGFAERIGFIGTRHAFGLRMLRRHGASMGYGERISIIDGEAATDLIMSKMQSLGCKTPLDQVVELKKKGRPTGPAFTPEELAVVSYLDEIREAGVVDVDTILPEFMRLIKAGTFPADIEHLLVDEVQDSSDLDWDIDLAFPAANKFFVGDPDQAIFGFRGGSVRRLLNILSDEKLPTTMIALEDNFRSTPAICEAANRLIGRNRLRVPKRVKSARTDHVEEETDGVHTFRAMSAGDEAGKVIDALTNLKPDGLEHSDIAIISRTNAIASEIRATLTAMGIPVAEDAKPELPRDWLFVRSAVEFRANPDNDTTAFFYLMACGMRNGMEHAEARKLAHRAKLLAFSAGMPINRVATGLYVERATLGNIIEELEAVDASREAIMLVNEKIKTMPSGSTVLDLALALATVDRGTAVSTPGVTCTTAHAAKGREWEAVFIVGAEDESWPGKRADTEEERRVMFVAVTRAKRALYLSSAATRQASWGYRPIEPRTPSRFIAEIEGRAEA